MDSVTTLVAHPWIFPQWAIVIPLSIGLVILAAGWDRRVFLGIGLSCAALAIIIAGSNVMGYESRTDSLRPGLDQIAPMFHLGYAQNTQDRRKVASIDYVWNNPRHEKATHCVVSSTHDDTTVRSTIRCLHDGHPVSVWSDGTYHSSH